MARHRYRRHARKQGGFMSMVNKAITPLSFAVAFVPQITSKDTVGNSTYAALSNTNKAKFLSNSIVGRMTGFNPFPQYGVHTFTVNPAGMLNNYTYAGAGGLILASILPKGLGGKSTIRKVSKGLFWGGVVGGFFDDPARQGVNTSNQNFGQGAYNQNLTTQLYNIDGSAGQYVG